MKNYTKAALLNALRELATNRHTVLTLDVDGWSTIPRHLLAEDALLVLTYEGLLAATPNESPEDYTEETYEGLVEWVETHVQDWVWEAIDWATEEAVADDVCIAQREQRDVNYDATSERLEALRKILSNLKNA
jgi:hypothetical protein